MRYIACLLLTCLLIYAGCASAEKGNSQEAAEIHVPSMERCEKDIAHESLKFGIFIHYTMEGFRDSRYPKGPCHNGKRHCNHSKVGIECYSPDKLDVEQWVRTIKAAGATYSVLTARHAGGGGLAMWHTKTDWDFNVANAPVKTDILKEFAGACRKHGLKYGFYYSVDGASQHIRLKDYPLVVAQVTELMKLYPDVSHMFFDGVRILKEKRRNELYQIVKRANPDCMVAMNAWPLSTAWPTDIQTFESWLRISRQGVFRNPDYPIKDYYPLEQDVQGRKYYLPQEVNECIPGLSWLWKTGAKVKESITPEHMYIYYYQPTVGRGRNLLLNMVPDEHGLIPDDQVEILTGLGEYIGNHPPPEYDPPAAVTPKVSVEGNQVRLVWTKNTDPDFASYEVFIMPKGEGRADDGIERIADRNVTTYSIPRKGRAETYSASVRVWDRDNWYVDSEIVHSESTF